MGERARMKEEWEKVRKGKGLIRRRWNWCAHKRWRKEGKTEESYPGPFGRLLQPTWIIRWAYSETPPSKWGRCCCCCCCWWWWLLLLLLLFKKLLPTMQRQHAPKPRKEKKTKEQVSEKSKEKGYQGPEEETSYPNPGNWCTQKTGRIDRRKEERPKRKTEQISNPILSQSLGN